MAARLRKWPPDLATPDSALGQLQRGHGAVARRVLEGEVPDGVEMVVGCIRSDPRWDRQLDARADYYGVLTLSLGLEADVLADIVAAEEGQRLDIDAGASLALGVLSARARNDDDAIDWARAYVATGRYWDQVVDDLVYGRLGQEPLADWRRHVDGVAEIIKERWPDPAELRRELSDNTAADPRRTPWREWGTEDPAISAALRPVERSPQSEPRPRERIRGRPTHELLALHDMGYLRVVAQKLATRTNARDVDAMRVVAADPSTPMHAAAVSALAAQQHVDVLPAVATLTESTPPGPARALLFRAFADLPYEATRALALDWLRGTDSARRGAAARALEKHAIDEDVPLVRELLTIELDAGLDGNQYRVCSYAGALGRHPRLGPYRELDRAFREMPYSYGRHFVVDALATTDRAFGTRMAVDCLWDAEEPIRAMAAKVVDREVHGVSARLADLASDPAEGDDVRTAARDVQRGTD